MPGSNSSTSSKRPTNQFVGLVAVFALIGLFDASYLTTEHYLNQTPVCLVTKGCDKVLTSSYATVFGIPLGLLGVGFYLTILAFTMASIRRPTHTLLTALAIFGAMGFIASMGFIYLQLAVLKAICFYCMISATTSTLIFLSALSHRHVTLKTL